MGRSRRRRANDRRRDADQRRVADEVLRQLPNGGEKLNRFVRSVFQNYEGEIVRGGDGKLYQIQEDGSLKESK